MHNVIRFSAYVCILICSVHAIQFRTVINVLWWRLDCSIKWVFSLDLKRFAVNVGFQMFDVEADSNFLPHTAKLRSLSTIKLTRYKFFKFGMLMPTVDRSRFPLISSVVRLGNWYLSKPLTVSIRLSTRHKRQQTIFRS